MVFSITVMAISLVKAPEHELDDLVVDISKDSCNPSG